MKKISSSLSTKLNQKRPLKKRSIKKKVKEKKTKTKGYKFETYVKGRRVYTGVKEGGQFVSTAFSKMLNHSAKAVDFSYTDLHKLGKRIIRKAAAKDCNEGVAYGASITSLNAESRKQIPLDKKKDIDSQLLGYHMMAYQYQNSPPTLKTIFKTNEERNQRNIKENAYRRHELKKTKAILKNYTRNHEYILPKTPTKGGAIQLDRMFGATVDVNRPQPGTLFSAGTYKAVFIRVKEIYKQAYKQAKLANTTATGAIIEPSVHDSTKHLSQAVIDDFKSQNKGGRKQYLERMCGITINECDGSKTLGIRSVTGDTELSELGAARDSMKIAMKKRAAFLNSFGILAKTTSQKYTLSASRKARKRYAKFIGTLNRNADKRSAQANQRFLWLYKQFTKLKRELKKKHPNKIKYKDIVFPKGKLKDLKNQEWVQAA